MEFDLYHILKLMGSIAFFLFGMKLMSESLQKVAGNNIRNILSAVSSTPAKGLFTGFLITSIIQSSSATTVMLISFVNAGLFSVFESLSIVLGANIGTTITGWIISVLGFKFNISMIVLPMIGLSFPLLFSRKNNQRSWGEVIIGFAIIFIGLDFMKSSVPDIHQNPGILEFLSNYTDKGYLSYLISFVIGLGITILIQSSSAAMALTIVMCNNGWIPFEMAAAMLVGENVGTTLTAILASTVANRPGKRTAVFHLLFNTIGAIWVLSLFPGFIRMIDQISLTLGLGSPINSLASIPIGLSLFHTVFNLINVLFLFWFIGFSIKSC